LQPLVCGATRLHIGFQRIQFRSGSCRPRRNSSVVASQGGICVPLNGEGRRDEHGAERGGLGF
jgi:hypothetical protein